MIADDISVLPKIPQRQPTAHKGTFGMVLGVGGSRGMSGAIVLAGKAALVCGSGLVRLAVPDPILETVAHFDPNYTTIPLSADRRGRLSLSAVESVLRHTETATAMFLGPGLGRSAGLDFFVARIVRNVDKPMVVDADALNALGVPDEPFGPNIVFTPHPGEFARLTGTPPPSEERLDERISVAQEFSKRFNVVLVLKGHSTIIVQNDRIAVNTTGNPGMATGGSGDVLTGMIASFLGQGFEPFDAARLGVYLHGLAGDIAAERVGQASVLATTIIESLPDALKRLL
jgi:NAD(P)H-hydrate epimerase